jgi:solute:Na+ symporter, SSS family
VLIVAMSGGWGTAFDVAARRFAQTPSPADGLLLPDGGHLGYLTLIIGSSLAIFAYPHALTGILAAKDRATIKRNAAALPIYVLALGLMGMLGFFAISQNIVPVGADFARGETGDLNTVSSELFRTMFPAWSAGLAYAAIAVAALIPAAVMSISAANLFTRSIYREYINRDAGPKQEAAVSRWASLFVKFLAVGALLLITPSFSVDLQLIGGVIVLQTLPAVFFGLLTAWFHRWALITGLVVGLGFGIGLLYQIPKTAPTGRPVPDSHFGSPNWPLSNFGLDTTATVYVGLLALALNLLVVVVITAVLRAFNIGIGKDATRPSDYHADADDPMLKRLDNLLDGLPRTSVGAHER